MTVNEAQPDCATQLLNAAGLPNEGHAVLRWLACLVRYESGALFGAVARPGVAETAALAPTAFRLTPRWAVRPETALCKAHSMDVAGAPGMPVQRSQSPSIATMAAITQWSPHGPRQHPSQ